MGDWRVSGIVPDSEDEDEGSFSDGCASIHSAQQLTIERPSGTPKSPQPDERTPHSLPKSSLFDERLLSSLPTSPLFEDLSAWSKKDIVDLDPESLQLAQVNSFDNELGSDRISSSILASNIVQAHTAETGHESHGSSPSYVNTSKVPTHNKETVDQLSRTLPFDTSKLSPVSSSPLSVLSNISALSLPDFCLENTTGLDQAGGDGRIEDKPVLINIQEIDSRSDSFRAGGLLQRRLRKRTTLQEHPYTEEDQKYRNSLRLRGILPVKIVPPSSSPAPSEASSQGDTRTARQALHESLHKDDGADSVVLDSNPNDSSGQRPFLVPSTVLRHREPNTAIFRQGDMPPRKRMRMTDLHLQKEKAVSPGNNSIRLVPSLHPLQRPGESDTQVIPHKNLVLDDSLFDSDSCAQTNENQSSESTDEDLRVPGRRKKIGPSQSAAQPAPNTSPFALSLVESESSSEPNESPPSSQERRKVQKRTKGVLPASWVRLDEQTRGVKATPQRPGIVQKVAKRPQAIPNLPRFGVARRVDGHQISAEDGQGFFSDLEGDDSSVSESNNHPQPVQQILPFEKTHPHDNNLVILTSGDEDAFEDASVDPMLPSHSNQHRSYNGHGRLGEQRQSRVNFLNGKITNEREGKFGPAPTKISSHTRRKRANKRKDATISRSVKPPPVPLAQLLDLAESDSDERPQFLKIARQTAQRKKIKVLQAPKVKAFKMDTIKETKEINGTLQSWNTILSGRSAQQLGKVREQHQRTKPSSSGKHMLSKTSSRQKASKLPTPSVSTGSSATIQAPTQRVARTPMAGPMNQPPSPKSLSIKGRKLSPKSRPPESRANTRRNVKKGSVRMNGQRQAQLESLEGQAISRRPGDMFGSELRQRGLDFTRLPDEIMRRYLADSGPKALSEAAQRDLHDKQATVIRRPRKRPPARVDVQNAQYQENEMDVNLPLYDYEIERPAVIIDHGHSLSGLSDLRADYTSAFDSKILPSGSFFHSSTFLGGEDLSQVLKSIKSRDYDNPQGFSRFDSGLHQFSWGKWNSNVSTELFSALEDFCSLPAPISKPGINPCSSREIIGRTQNIGRSLNIYVATNLTFSGRSDRSRFLQDFCEGFPQLLSSCFQEPVVVESQPFRLPSCRALQFLHLFILAFQVRTIASHTLVDPKLLSESTKILIDITKRFLRYLMALGIRQLKSLYRDLEQQSYREAGIKEEGWYAQCWLVIFHVLHDLELQSLCFWTLFDEAMRQNLDLDSKYAPTLESAWEELSSILPLLDFSEQGLLRPRRNEESVPGSWPLVNSLANTVFASLRDQGGRTNSYIRAILIRYHKLITYWGWSGYEVALRLVYDFFADNKLENLPNEQVLGSPAFLQSLDHSPPIRLEPGDRAFHIVLKLLAEGLKLLRLNKSPQEKRLQNLVRRLMPNHDRHYPREKAMYTSDLDALRNHHDLLATLFWVAPVSARPRLTAIERLVDTDSSHSAACLLNIQTWRNLVRFQLSTTAEASSLQPFAQWHSNLVAQILEQHKDAHKEARSYAYSATDLLGVQALSALPSHLEQTVNSNEKQIESMLVGLLKNMLGAMELAQGPGYAMWLVTKESTSDMFELFDANKQRLNALVFLALKICQAFIGKCQEQTQSNSGSESLVERSEESQEYGSFDDLDSLEAANTKNEALVRFDSITSKPLYRLLSNVFGADKAPPDDLLGVLVDTWIQAAQLRVAQSKNTWAEFLNAHHSESWTNLRVTEQTRKYTSFVLWKAIEADPESYHENQMTVLGHWVTSLVERESMLKYQHGLTATLLNADKDNSLFLNLPFWRRGENSLYSISLEEFRERRLSLISSIMSNMRTAYDDAAQNNHLDGAQVKANFTELLKSISQNMQHNYLELSHGQSSLKEAYITFVHKVLEFHQQYLNEIFPIDKVFKFFNDRNRFPQPRVDTSYVVARLKGCGESLSKFANPTLPISFILTLCDQEARQQFSSGHNTPSKLAEYLCNACADNTYAAGSVALRTFLSQALFPALVSAFITRQSSLARPALEAIVYLASSILATTDLCSSAAITVALTSTTSLIQALTSSQALQDLRARTVLLKTGTTLLLPLDYLVSRLGSHLRGDDDMEDDTDLRADIVIAAARAAVKGLAAMASGSTPATRPVAGPLQLGRGMVQARQIAEREVRALVDKEKSREVVMSDVADESEWDQVTDQFWRTLRRGKKVSQWTEMGLEMKRSTEGVLEFGPNDAMFFDSESHQRLRGARTQEFCYEDENGD
ncbi:MAG: hypothetical protein M1814_005414 [Vezdaea aestivalis]|nr:MAG: hypothetical protein M1814_005414 [Vezdaea aestivalis]